MALQNTDSYLIEVDQASSLPDPTTVVNRTHEIDNTSGAAVAITSTGATPFTENGVNVVSVSLPRGESKLFHSDGTHWIVGSSGFLQAPAVATPARVLGTAFTPSATRPVLGIYTVSISAITSLLAGDDGTIQLQADNGAPATVRAEARNSMTQTVGVTVGTRGIQESVLTFLFPAGWQGKLVTVTNAGAPVFSIIAQTEITL